MTEQVILEGRISIDAALRSGNRTLSVIYMRRGISPEAGEEMQRLASVYGVKVRRVSDEVIAGYASGKSHGGIIALAGARRFLPLADLAREQHTPFIAMLDGIEDPFNFGAAIRALYAAGADGLVVRPRNWMDATGVVARASAGASELIATALAESVQEAASFFRLRGLTVACTTHHRQATSIYAANLARPLFLVIGGEKRGITRSFSVQGDLSLHIPMLPDNAPALTSATAAAIVAFEVLRQRVMMREQAAMLEKGG